MRLHRADASLQAANPPCRAICRLQDTAAARKHVIVAATSTRRQCLLAKGLMLQQLCTWSSNFAAAQQENEAGSIMKKQKVVLAGIQADYDRYAATYNELDGGAASQVLGLPKLRQQLLQQASGNVLEVAVGTGLNLPLYNWSKINAFTGVDLSQGMLSEAAGLAATIRSVHVQAGSSDTHQQGGIGSNTVAGPPKPKSRGVADGNSSSSGSNDNSENDTSSSGGSSSSSGERTGDITYHTAADAGARNTSLPVRLVQADAARLPFPDSSFDTVLDTFSLCVLDKPKAALTEMWRVLRPDGRLLLLEHSRSDNAFLGAYQAATRSLVAPLSKGCDWSQDVPAMVGALPALHISRQQRHLAGMVVDIIAIKH